MSINPDTNTKIMMEDIKREKRQMRLSAVIAAQDMWVNPDSQRGVRKSEIIDFISFANDIYKFIANGTLKKEK